MKILGWCERCHRVRQVRVRIPHPGGVQIGVCDECERKEETR